MEHQRHNLKSHRQHHAWLLKHQDNHCRNRVSITKLQQKSQQSNRRTFIKQIAKRYRQCVVYQEEINLCLSLTDRIRQNVVHFIHFKHFKLYFNFIFLELVGKKGTEDSKKLFPLRKNSLLSNWTQIAEIILVITTYDHSNENLLNGDTLNQ